MITPQGEREAMLTECLWVKSEDFDRVFRAASALLQAIHKNLPLGAFSLIEQEYNKLQKEMYGQN